MNLYGISNCDTVKKARTFLEKKKISYQFIDFKTYCPTHEDIMRWSESFGSLPINPKGTTYRKHKLEFDELNEQEKIKFLQQHTSMIKRPILEIKNKVLAFGFDEKFYSLHFC